MDDLQRPRVAGYEVVRLLGQGGSASVWLVREERTGCELALKSFRRTARRTARGEPMTEEGIRREIRILSVLDHPHLVKAHGAVTVDNEGDGAPALVMDYAAAGSLGDLVAVRGRLTVGETVTVLTPLAQVLAYLHGNGFTHGDVSPGNVLFTSGGKPMLADLGIARMLGEPAAAAGRGTPGFADPGPVDAVRAGLQPGSDVYSAAALGWFCLTGMPPDRSSDRPPLTLLVPEVPRELAAALESGLTEDRRQRPTAAALGAAVYRSAPPLPLDLAPAVHPTVLPDLVTRLHAAAPPGGVRGRIGNLRRRLATAAVAGIFSHPRKRPLPAPGRAGAAADLRRGRHTMPRGGRNIRRALSAAAAAAAVAGASWLTLAALAAAGQDAGPPGGSAEPAVSAPEPGIPGEPQQAGRLEAARQQAGSPDPVVAVQGLAALRSLAYSSGRLDLLDEVNQPGSGASKADREVSERLRDSGHTLAGFAGTLSGVQAEEGGSAARTVVSVTSASSGYEEKDAGGAVVATGTAGAEQRLRLVLVSVEGRWRLSEILPGS